MVSKCTMDNESAAYRAAVVPVTLTGASYRLAHDSCHRAALLWNQAVNWSHGEWKAKCSPNKYDIQGFLNSIPRQDRPRIDLSIPTVLDSATNKKVDLWLWGEIQLCWDRDKRHFSLHIPYETLREVSVGDAVSAIDEGIINSMGLATWVDDKTIDVTIINGREARVTSSAQNRALSETAQISRPKPANSSTSTDSSVPDQLVVVA